MSRTIPETAGAIWEFWRFLNIHQTILVSAGHFFIESYAVKRFASPVQVQRFRFDSATSESSFLDENHHGRCGMKSAVSH